MEVALGRMKEKSYSQRKDEITINRLKEISKYLVNYQLLLKVQQSMKKI